MIIKTGSCIKRLHERLLMFKLWGFLCAIFGVIPEKLGCDNTFFVYYGSMIPEKLGCHPVKVVRVSAQN